MAIMSIACKESRTITADTSDEELKVVVQDARRETVGTITVKQKDGRAEDVIFTSPEGKEVHFSWTFHDAGCFWMQSGKFER